MSERIGRLFKFDIIKVVEESAYSVRCFTVGVTVGGGPLGVSPVSKEGQKFDPLPTD